MCTDEHFPFPSTLPEFKKKKKSFCQEYFSFALIIEYQWGLGLSLKGIAIKGNISLKSNL